MKGLSSILQKHNLRLAVTKIAEAVEACRHETTPAVERADAAALAHEWALPRLRECADEVRAFFQERGDDAEVGPKRRWLHALAVLDAYLKAMKEAGKTSVRENDAQVEVDFIRKWQAHVQSFEEDD